MYFIIFSLSIQNKNLVYMIYSFFFLLNFVLLCPVGRFAGTYIKVLLYDMDEVGIFPKVELPNSFHGMYLKLQMEKHFLHF